MSTSPDRVAPSRKSSTSERNDRNVTSSRRHTPKDDEELSEVSSGDEADKNDKDVSASESESESEYDSDESEDEILFDFFLTKTGEKKILNKGDITSTFATDVAVHAAKLGAEIRKKSDSLRIVGPKYTLKLCAQSEESDDIAQAFEQISAPLDVSDEAKLMAYFLASS